MLSKIRIHTSVLFVLALLILSAAAIAQEEAAGPSYAGMRWDAPTYAQHGPYWIGARNSIEIERDGRLLRGTIWYPALNPDGAEYDMAYTSWTEDIWESWGMDPAWSVLSGQALANAPVDLSGAPYPLIIFTHGFSISRTVSTYLMEHLASHGFVVMAVDHPGGGFIDQLTYGFGTPELSAFIPATFVDWALDEMRVIAYAEELTSGDGDFAGAIDTSRVGTAGYSTGGNVALQMAGAQLDYVSIRSDFGDYCDAFTEEDEFTSEIASNCLMPNRQEELAALTGVEYVEDAPLTVVPNSPVQAVFTMAPGVVIPFGTNGLSAVTVPTVIVAGTLDVSVMPELIQHTYDALGAEAKSLVWLENANHFIFMDCDWQASAFGGFCADGVWDMQRAYDLTNHFATALFLGVLYDDADAMSALHPDAVKFAGITYETTLDN